MGCFSHKIFLDMHSTISQASLHVKLGDTNWKICAILTENGKTYNIPEGSTAKFTGKKADNTDLFNDCVIENNTVVYDFTEQTCTSVGRVDCEIRLIDAEGKIITSPSFTIVVDDTVIDEDHIIESNDEVLALTNLITDVETKLENGEFKGDDGYTPVKGVDYFTPAEQEAFLASAKDYTDEKTAPANSYTYGTIRAFPEKEVAQIGGGIRILDDGYLSLVPASEYAIDDRYMDNVAITPSNLEYAVKSVGDGYYVKEEDLSKCVKKTTTKRRVLYGSENGEEKTFGLGYANSAEVNTIPFRALGGGIYIPNSAIGATGSTIPAGLEAVNKNYVDNLVAPKEYELINTITVSPDTDGTLPQHVIFSTDSEGNPFELTDFYVHLYAGMTDGSKSTLYVYVNKDVSVLANVNVGFEASKKRSCLVYSDRLNNGFLKFVATPSNATAVSWNSQLGEAKVIPIPPSSDAELMPITKIDLCTLLGDNKTWIDGSTFKLYGVRK